MKITVSTKKISDFNALDIEKFDFPKYTTQLINLANQNAQGTRPKVVGQLSELFPEYEDTTEGSISLENWKSWYNERHPEAIDNATEKVYNQVRLLQEAMPKITKEMVHEWVKDLVHNKTFEGLYLQKFILATIANQKGLSFRLANPAEEAKGIDGYIGDKPYSIKPDSYKQKRSLQEEIDVTMIYYKKDSDGKKLVIEIDE